MLIDISHPLTAGQPSFPGDPELELDWSLTIAEGGANVTRLVMSTHQGTHLDAPLHFFSDGAPADEIPLDRFYGPASLVDLAPGGWLPARSDITIDLLQKRANLFRTGARVILRTGWDREFGTVEFFTEFPSLTLDAVRWMVSRRIGLLGMDTPSPTREITEAHRMLLAPSSPVVIVESLAGLERLPDRFIFIGFPIRLAGRDGSPIRAVALVDDSCDAPVQESDS